MKAQIQSYTAPDLSKYDQQMGVLGERMTSVERLAKLNSESLGYVTDNVTRNVNSAVQAVQAVDSRTRAIDQASTQTSQSVLNAIRAQDRETQQRLDDLKDANEKRLKELETGVDLKIQKTLANPLAGQ
jgi:DNA anti-recombination protein RmuC